MNFSGITVHLSHVIPLHVKLGETVVPLAVVSSFSYSISMLILYLDNQDTNSLIENNIVTPSSIERFIAFTTFTIIRL